ncbi:hypothetical protein [Ochrobactrum soli]|nr:hypothetical protein [[Ochrobactrum] soli]
MDRDASASIYRAVANNCLHDPENKIGKTMSETITLDTHDAIREWAALRNGNPAFVITSVDLDEPPLLRIVFEPEFFADVERPLDATGLEVVEWDDWFEVFDQQGLAMLVATPQPGKLDNFYQVLKA